MDGTVIERKVDPGQTVAASFVTPELFIIAPDMDKHMYVFASVDEADIGQIRTAQERGKAVKFTVDAYPGDLFEGKIHQIRKNSTTTQNVVTYPVVIEAPNPDLKLLPGMTANITFQIEARDDVLRVPAAALRFVPLTLAPALRSRNAERRSTGLKNPQTRSAKNHRSIYRSIRPAHQMPTMRPQSTAITSSPDSISIMLRPISPRPPRGISRTTGSTELLSR